MIRLHEYHYTGPRRSLVKVRSTSQMLRRKHDLMEPFSEGDLDSERQSVVKARETSRNSPIVVSHRHHYGIMLKNGQKTISSKRRGETDAERSYPSPTLPPTLQVETKSGSITVRTNMASNKLSHDRPTPWHWLDTSPQIDVPIMLVHGWTSTADLTWHTHYENLGKNHTFAAFDMRGHGVGIRSEQFTLADCAQDVLDVASALGWDKFVIIAHSMGGAIAQLVALDSPKLVVGLVLCSTAAVFAETRQDRIFFENILGSANKALASVPKFVRDLMPGRVTPLRQDDDSYYHEWAESQIRNHDVSAIVQAAQELGRFDTQSRLGELMMPISVLVTTKDTVVAPTRQKQLVAQLNNVESFEIVTDHHYLDEQESIATLQKAMESVAVRLLTPFERAKQKALVRVDKASKIAAYKITRKPKVADRD